MRLVKQVPHFYTVDVVGIINGSGLCIDEYYRNQPNTCKVLLFPLPVIQNGCTQVTRLNTSVMKVGVACVGMRFKSIRLFH